MDSPAPYLQAGNYKVVPDEDVWHFLDEIDAPRWADLHEEAVLAASGLEGDDPWFHRSHSNHEKSLDELAEETGTFTFGLSSEDEAAAGQTTPSPTFRHLPLSKSASPSPSLPGVLAGNLSRIDLRRLGGGAQRLNSRALRVPQDDEVASSISPVVEPLEPGASHCPTAAASSHADKTPVKPSEKPSPGIEIAPDFLDALAGILQYGADSDSPDTPSSSASHQSDRKEENARQFGPREGRRSVNNNGPELPRLSKRGSASEERRSGGRGMQLPVAAAGRQGEETGDERPLSQNGMPVVDEVTSVGRKKVWRKSLGGALRVEVQVDSGKGPKKKSPVLAAKPRRSADGAVDSLEKVKLAFGRRIEQLDPEARAKKLGPSVSPPLQLCTDKAGVQALSKHPAQVGPAASKLAPTASGKLKGASQHALRAETRPLGLQGGASAKAGRIVPARTDTGRGQTGTAGSVPHARGPLATLANSNGQVRSTAAKGAGSKQAVRIQGPGLSHASGVFTPAPLRPGSASGGWDGEKARKQRSSGSAESAAPRTRSSNPSIISADEPENRIPPDTTLASALGQQSRPLGEEDQDIAAMLAQHNRRFKIKPAYEPRLHSVRDTKEWELLTGKTYYKLDPGEREEANNEIKRMKQNRADVPNK